VSPAACSLFHRSLNSISRTSSSEAERYGRPFAKRVSSLMLILALQNLFPVQIENVLTAHPGVLEAAAIAVPDPVYGEVVGAWVVRRPGSHPPLSREDVRKHVSNGMNPQVRALRFPFTSLSLSMKWLIALGAFVLHRMRRRGPGLWATT
jgi:acyl-CoA synthetase (AMP-forming)/AMP-acid ligase II